uniref:uncharacterized protein LOC117601888 isoform X2 n=1 Tax=Osmia lignaria TaxID=473952 RepID=UPI0014795CA3|nr:uncharacterized protein LOC117601888 isoform X2 [Osmia lignaria]
MCNSWVITRTSLIIRTSFFHQITYIGQHRIKGTHCLVVTDVYTLYDVTTESHTAPGKVNGGKRKEKINSTLPMDGYEKRDRYLCIFLIAILRYQGNLILSYHIFVLSVCPTRVLDIDWLRAYNYIIVEFATN